MYEERIHTQQQQLHKLEQQVGEQQQQILALVQERDQANDAHEQYRQAYNEQRTQSDTLQARIRELEQALEQQREQLQTSRQQLDERHGALQTATRELQQHQSALATLRAEYQALETSHATAAREAAAVDEAGWKRELERMQRDTQQQQQFVQELRTEVASLLEELRRLSVRNDAMTSDKESDVAIIRDLHTQMSSYKRQYDQVKSELDATKAASSQRWVQSMRSDEWMHVSEHGLVADTHLVSFHASIDELLAASRSSTPSSVLVAMKSVVLSTTLINEDVAKNEHQPDQGLEHLTPQQREDVQSLKVSLNEALSNLMNACRNHANAQGLAPVSLIDAAATHVAMAVAEMAKLVKLRRLSALDKPAYDARSEQEPSSAGLRPLHIGQRSAIASPPSSSSAGIGRGRRQPSATRAYLAAGAPEPVSNESTDDTERTRVVSAGRYLPVRYASGTRSERGPLPEPGTPAPVPTEAPSAPSERGTPNTGAAATGPAPAAPATQPEEAPAHDEKKDEKHEGPLSILTRKLSQGFHLGGHPSKSPTEPSSAKSSRSPQLPSSGPSPQPSYDSGQRLAPSAPSPRVPSSSLSPSMAQQPPASQSPRLPQSSPLVAPLPPSPWSASGASPTIASATSPSVPYPSATQPPQGLGMKGVGAAGLAGAGAAGLAGMGASEPRTLVDEPIPEERSWHPSPTMPSDAGLPDSAYERATQASERASPQHDTEPVPMAWSVQDNQVTPHGPRAMASATPQTGTGELARVSEVEDRENWAELRNYIEVQTEAIVHSIQSLLSALREGVQGPQLNENLTQITTIVFSIVAISRDHLSHSTSPQHGPITAEAERIFAELTENCDRLSDMQSDTSFDRMTKSVMASASYGVAKGLKSLNELLNEADEAAVVP